MGLKGEFKKWLKITFPECWLTAIEAEELEMPSVVIFDATYLTKYILSGFKTGLDFMNKQVISDVDPSFKAGALVVYQCYDRGSPKNKDGEHLFRYDKVEVMERPTTHKELSNLLTEDLGNGSVPSSSFSAKSRTFCQKPSALSELEEEGSYLVIADDRLPKKGLWKAIMGNQYMKRQMMHYMTQALVMDTRFPEIIYKSGVMIRQGGSTNEMYGYSPPKGGILCLHGGCSNRPTPNGTMIRHTYDEERNVLEWEEVPYKPDDKLITITTEPEEKGSHIRHDYMRPPKRVVGTIEDRYPPEVVDRILEGEIATMYYSLHHNTDNQLKVTGDGDLILLELLACRRRLLPGMKNLGNEIHLRLKIPGTKTVTIENPKTGKETKKSISKDDYLKVNRLYESITAHKKLKRLRDPICVMVLVSALMGNDYVKEFGSGFNTADDQGLPWLLYPFMMDPDKYKNLVYASKGEPNEILEVFLDEDLFYRYVKECYFYTRGRLKKVQNAIPVELLGGNPDYNFDTDSRKHKKGSLGDNEALLGPFYLEVRKNEALLDKMMVIINRTKAPTEDFVMSYTEAVSHARRVKWLLLYWLNGCVGSCEYPDPCEKIGGISYYGWEMRPFVSSDPSKTKKKMACLSTTKVYIEEGKRRGEERPKRQEPIKVEKKRKFVDFAEKQPPLTRRPVKKQKVVVPQVHLPKATMNQSDNVTHNNKNPKIPPPRHQFQDGSSFDLKSFLKSRGVGPYPGPIGIVNPKK